MMFAEHHTTMKAPKATLIRIIVGVGIKAEYMSKTESLLKHTVAFQSIEKVMIPCSPNR